MNLKCVVIDDEPWAIELMKKYVGKVPFLKLVHSLCDPAKAVDFFKENQIDLVFIDINMPAGIELLKSMLNKPITIFTSSYKQYALQGFEFGALDYLLKPLDFERFSKAVSRAMELFRLRQFSWQGDHYFLFVRSGNKTIRVQLNEIEYIEGCVNYIKIHIINDKPILTLTTLNEILKKLPADKFSRIHRSYIIPIAQVKEIRNKKVLLYSLKELPISNSHSDFNKQL